MELFRFYNHAINFADCTILVSMQKHGITRIATFDSDFEQMKQIMAKVSDLENKIKNDLYPANLNKQKGK